MACTSLSLSLSVRVCCFIKINPYSPSGFKSLPPSIPTLLPSPSPSLGVSECSRQYILCFPSHRHFAELDPSPLAPRLQLIFYKQTIVNIQLVRLCAAASSAAVLPAPCHVTEHNDHLPSHHSNFRYRCTRTDRGRTSEAGRDPEVLAGLTLPYITLSVVSHSSRTTYGHFREKEEQTLLHPSPCGRNEGKKELKHRHALMARDAECRRFLVRACLSSILFLSFPGAGAGF